MAEDTETSEEMDEEAPAKRSKMPLILGVVFALLGGGGGFMAVNMGLIGGDAPEEPQEEVVEAEEMPPLAFVPMETLVINLPEGADARHLLFTAQLEVDPEYMSEVEALLPRVVDILKVVVGDGRVRDILIMEFVLN